MPSSRFLLANRRCGAMLSFESPWLLFLADRLRDAERAARAILGRYLQRVFIVGKFLPARCRALERRWRVGKVFGLVYFGANDRVRTDEDALAALDTDVLVPHRDLERDVALFPPRRIGGISPVDGQCADRQLIPLPAIMAAVIFWTNSAPAPTRAAQIERARDLARDSNSCRFSSVRSTATKFFWTTVSPRLP